MTTTLRERRKQLLRDEILQATHQLVLEKGFAAMSMDEVAAQAGISKPTLYSHFATKEDLIIAAIMRKMERVLALVESDDPSQSPLERLMRLLRAFIQRDVDEGMIGPRTWMPEIFQLLCSREDSLAYLRRIDAAIVRLVQAGVANGEIASGLDPAIVVRTFFALVGSAHMPPFASAAPPPNPSVFADTLVTIFTNGVRAKA